MGGSSLGSYEKGVRPRCLRKRGTNPQVTIPRRLRLLNVARLAVEAWESICTGKIRMPLCIHYFWPLPLLPTVCSLADVYSWGMTAIQCRNIQKVELNAVGRNISWEHMGIGPRHYKFNVGQIGLGLRRDSSSLDNPPAVEEPPITERPSPPQFCSAPPAPLCAVSWGSKGPKRKNALQEIVLSFRQYRNQLILLSFFFRYFCLSSRCDFWQTHPRPFLAKQRTSECCVANFQKRTLSLKKPGIYIELCMQLEFILFESTMCREASVINESKLARIITLCSAKLVKADSIHHARYLYENWPVW